jgi:uncharacterized protein YndB with AHSA1/START domain
MLTQIEPVAEGTNSRFRFTVETAAPASAIWALWTNASAWPQWDVELERSSIDGAFRAGATGVLKGKGAPEAAFAVTRFEPAVSYAFSTRLPLGGALVIERRLEALPSGTRFTHEVRFEGFGGWLFAPFFGPRYRRALPVAMKRIATLAEGGAP